MNIDLRFNFPQYSSSIRIGCLKNLPFCSRNWKFASSVHRGFSKFLSTALDCLQRISDLNVLPDCFCRNHRKVIPVIDYGWEWKIDNAIPFFFIKFNGGREDVRDLDVFKKMQVEIKLNLIKKIFSCFKIYSRIDRALQMTLVKLCFNLKPDSINSDESDKKGNQAGQERAVDSQNTMLFFKVFIQCGKTACEPQNKTQCYRQNDNVVFNLKIYPDSHIRTLANSFIPVQIGGAA